jgi:hypothetical protein
MQKIPGAPRVGLRHRDAAAALEAAVLSTKKLHGSADVAWGTVYRLRQGNINLSANGGPGDLGVFRVVGYRTPLPPAEIPALLAIRFPAGSGTSSS